MAWQVEGSPVRLQKGLSPAGNRKFAKLRSPLKKSWILMTGGCRAGAHGMEVLGPGSGG